jgi:acyl-coenzyme A thioesterase PaaI-like protein
VAKPSFLTDEHIPNAVMRGLRARGIDASTTGEAGHLGASDTALLAFAKAQGRILITADADHLRLHAAGVPHAGILFAPPDAAIGLLIGGAMLIAEVLTAEEMVNRVEFL